MQPHKSGKISTSAEALISIDLDIEARQTAILGLEQQIMQQKTEICALKSKKNTLAAVTLLSNELLCVIFVLAMSEGDPFTGESRVPKGIQITHVCRHWRSVALSYPNLWSNISPGLSRHWISAMLQRSHPADLSIKFDYDYGNLQPGKLKEIFSHSKRIVHLRSLGMRPEQIQMILNCLPNSAPSLETLRLIGTRSFRNSLEESNVIPPGALVDVFNLRMLELSVCSVAWDSHLLENLICLKLCDIPLSTRPTIIQLFKVLSKLIGLECLELQDAFSVLPNDEKASRIHFGCLTRLAISSKVTEVQAFIHSVTFPTTAKVEISMFISPTSTFDFVRLLSDATGSYAFPVSELNFKTLAVDHALGSISFRLRLFLDTVSRYDDLSKIADWCFRVDHFGQTLPNDDSLFTDFWNSKIFNLREVSHVHLERAEMTSDVLNRTLGSLPQIAFIRLAETPGDSGRAFMSLLTDKRKSETVIFPKLSTINFERVRFKTIQPSITAYDIDFGQLRTCLIQRAAWGAAVKNISIRLCSGVGDADVLFLQQNIENVDWDKGDWADIAGILDMESDIEDDEEGDAEDYDWEDYYDDDSQRDSNDDYD